MVSHRRRRGSVLKLQQTPPLAVPSCQLLGAVVVSSPRHLQAHKSRKELYRTDVCEQAEGSESHKHRHSPDRVCWVDTSNPQIAFKRVLVAASIKTISQCLTSTDLDDVQRGTFAYERPSHEPDLCSSSFTAD